eukprot:jgi/Tetstr1/455282/TSEL_042118.t1
MRGKFLTVEHLMSMSGRTLRQPLAPRALPPQQQPEPDHHDEEALDEMQALLQRQRRAREARQSILGVINNVSELLAARSQGSGHLSTDVADLAHATSAVSHEVNNQLEDMHAALAGLEAGGGRHADLPTRVAELRLRLCGLAELSSAVAGRVDERLASLDGQLAGLGGGRELPTKVAHIQGRIRELAKLSASVAGQLQGSLDEADERLAVFEQATVGTAAPIAVKTPPPPGDLLGGLLRKLFGRLPQPPTAPRGAAASTGTGGGHGDSGDARGSMAMFLLFAVAAGGAAVAVSRLSLPAKQRTGRKGRFSLPAAELEEEAALAATHAESGMIAVQQGRRVLCHYLALLLQPPPCKEEGTEGLLLDGGVEPGPLLLEGTCPAAVLAIAATLPDDVQGDNEAPAPAPHADEAGSAEIVEPEAPCLPSPEQPPEVSCSDQNLEKAALDKQDADMLAGLKGRLQEAALNEKDVVPVEPSELRTLLDRMSKAEGEATRSRGLVERLSSEVSVLWEGLDRRMEMLGDSGEDGQQLEAGLSELVVE